MNDGESGAALRKTRTSRMRLWVSSVFALELFRQRGFEETTIRDIGSAAARDFLEKARSSREACALSPSSEIRSFPLAACPHILALIGIFWATKSEQLSYNADKCFSHFCVLRAMSFFDDKR